MKTTALFCLTALITILLFGCLGIYPGIDPKIEQFGKIKSQIDLGDSKEKFFEIVGPIMDGLSTAYSKSPDKYLEDGKVVEIYYVRSARFGDGLTTDDEFTPYVFNDSVLVSIGWAILGGPKTHGQVLGTPQINVNTSNTNVVD